MKIRELMTPSIETAEPNDTLQAAARIMRDSDVGGLPVVDDGKVVGFITDRDIVTRATALAHDPTDTPVSEIMTDQAYTVGQDQDLNEAQAIMKEHRVRRLIVVDGDGKPVGLLSLGDLALHPGIENAAAAVLQSVSEPTHAEASHA